MISIKRPIILTYYGDVALCTKPVMLIWTLIIPATRGHVIQSKVLAMITDCNATL